MDESGVAAIIAVISLVIGGLLLEQGMIYGWISLGIGGFASFAGGWIAEQNWSERFEDR